MAFKILQASSTLLVIGPAVSCECDIGIIPALETSPKLGLIPTIPFA